jgi:hypothetical protein
MPDLNGFPTISKRQAIQNGADLSKTEREGLDWTGDVIYSEQPDEWRRLDYYQVVDLSHK